MENYLSLLEFTRWIQTGSGQTGAIQLEHQDHERAPNWNNIKPTDDQLLGWKKRLNDGERLHFIVPTKVQRIDENPAPARFEVFLERDNELRGSEDHFIRGGLKISGISSLRQREMRGLVVVDEEPLVTMLGDAENPAHTEWQYDARGFKDKYKHAHSCLYFVINSVKNLANFILSAGTETDLTLLEDYFSLPGGEQEKKKKDAGDEGTKGEQTEVPDVVIVKEPNPVRLENLEGGFAVRSTGKGKKPRVVDVEVAYDIPRGNPLRHYVLEDFDLRKAPFTISHLGVEDPQILSNQISFLVAGRDFKLSVRGFDPRRDLYLSVNWSGNEE
ncbi:MAG: hypothetical protein ACC700_18855 [Anaerolineales bacterium]